MCAACLADDDFTYDCEQIEVVISADEALPDGAIDLNAPDVHAFYNAQSADAISLSMRCAAAPFDFGGKRCAAATTPMTLPCSRGRVDACERERDGLCSPALLGRYETLEECWRALESETIERRRIMLAEAIEVQYRTEAAATSGLRRHLLDTSPKRVVCVDIDPWLGMQAAGGISAGQNGMGRALMATRDALLLEEGGGS